MLAIEACLIHKLDTIFCPSDVLEIDDETISALASEDSTISTERAHLTEKLEVLQEGLRSLQGYQEHPPLLKDEHAAEDILPDIPGLIIDGGVAASTQQVVQAGEPPVIKDKEITALPQSPPPPSLSQIMLPAAPLPAVVDAIAVLPPKKKKKKEKAVLSE